jgi:hypothetical protein
MIQWVLFWVARSRSIIKPVLTSPHLTSPHLFFTAQGPFALQALVLNSLRQSGLGATVM